MEGGRSTAVEAKTPENELHEEGVNLTMNKKVERAIAKQKFDKLRKMADGRDESLKLEALEAMGQVSGVESFNYLTMALRNPSASIRAAAAVGLAALKDPKAIAFLAHQLEKETDQDARNKIEGAMAASR